MRTRAVHLVAVIAALLTVTGSAALADPVFVPETTRLYMRNSGTSCPGTPYLAIEAGTGEPGCGYIGGAPFGELYRTGVENFGNAIRTYASDESVPALTLDAIRNVKGVNRVVATATTNRMALGQIRVDVTVTGTDANNAQVALGSHSSETIVNPTNSAEVDFPFEIDVSDDLDQVELRTVTVAVEIRGWHVLTGYHRLSGQSWMDLPTYGIEDPATP